MGPAQDSAVGRAPVWSFVLRVVAWLAPCFALWYFIAPWQARVVAWIAKVLIGFDGQGLIAKLEFNERLVTFVTTIDVHAGAQVGVLAPDVNPMVYTFGLPLFLALMLGCKANWQRILVGIALLLPFEAVSVAFDVLSQVVIKSGYEATVRSGYSSFGREIVALGYQLGSLILPTVAPILAWGFLERKFVMEKILENAKEPS